MNAYSGYTYKRYKKRKRIFPWVTGILLIILGAFIANLFLGCVRFGPKPENFTTPELVFYAVVSGTYNTRTEAAAQAKSDEHNGLAGFVTAEYLVISEVFLTERENTREFAVPPTEITLVRKEHKTLFAPLFDKFTENFAWLCAATAEFQTQKLTPREIADAAVLRYKTLQQLAADLDEIQERAQSPLYATTLLALNKQAIALYILSTEAASPNFLHELRRAACTAAFSYHEMTKNLGSRATPQS